MSVKHTTIDASFISQFLGTLKTSRKSKLKKTAPRPERKPTGYRQAAAVLGSFDLDSLIAYPRVKDRPGTVTAFLSDIKPLDGSPSTNVWTLRYQPRRETLRRLKTREKMRKARAANPGVEITPLQRMIDLVIQDKPIDLSGLEHEELVALLTVRRWFEGILDGLPSKAELRQNLALSALRAPLEKLAGPNGADFVGREDELEQLRGYVGVLPAGNSLDAVWRFVYEVRDSLFDRPPMFIHGPGGVGKSTLISKFILEHTNREGGDTSLPSIYLNFDRPALNPRMPISLLFEAAQQLAQQFEEIAEQAKRFIENLKEGLSSADRKESIKSAFSQRRFIKEFAELCNQLPDNKAPILFVLDTFEEVQFIGHPVVELIWDLMEKMQRAQPRLRFVLSGRAEPHGGLTARPVELEDLDKKSAKTFLKRKFAQIKGSSLSNAVLEEIVDVVGTNPLCLMLTTWLVEREGIGVLSTVETRRFFLIQVKAERIQAQLYDRILAHIHDGNTKHGKQLRQIAHPGLIVRRITADVIREVLAGPCELELKSAEEAEELLRLLKREAALVEVDLDDHEYALRHLAEVRRLMLPDLVATQQEKIRQIDEAAVQYYSKFRRANMRAEEIYHRLRLGQSAEDIDPRWMPDVSDKLRGALDELEPEQRLYLTQKLGVTPEPDLLDKAGQAAWEKGIETSVRTYLAEGQYGRALKELKRRKKRLPGSVLYFYEATALFGHGDKKAAIKAAKTGLKTMAEASNKGPADAAALQLLISQIEESSGNLEAALEPAERAISLADKGNDVLVALQARLTRIRLLRKLDRDRFDDIRDLTKRLNRSHLVSQLRQRPAIARELAAEIAQIDTDMLHLAMETIGIEFLDETQADLLAEVLGEWNAGDNKKQQGDLAESLGLDHGLPSFEDWRAWIDGNTGARLNDQIRRSLYHFEPSDAIRQKIGGLFQRSVEQIMARDLDLYS